MAITEQHRAEARRILINAGYPPPAGRADRLRRRHLLDALATTLATAETRALADAAPTIRDAAYINGLTDAFTATLDALHDHPEAVAAVMTVAHSYGLDLNPPQPTSGPCTHPQGHHPDPDDGFHRCPHCDDTAPRPLLVRDDDYTPEALDRDTPAAGNQ